MVLREPESNIQRSDEVGVDEDPKSSMKSISAWTFLQRRLNVRPQAKGHLMILPSRADRGWIVEAGGC